MKNIFISFLFLICLNAFAQENEHVLSIHDSLQETTDEIIDSLIQIRRYLHENPEVSGYERNTSIFIAKYLNALGLKVYSNIGGYGVVGILNEGKNGNKIVWRADIDAVKTDEPDIVDFKSANKGVRHICGHDVHTAIGLGLASVLSKHKDKIKGTVCFLFQPAEENGTGAKAMLEDGLFNLFSPNEIYGLHIGPMPVGLIVVKPNEVYNYAYALRIKYKNHSTDILKTIKNQVLQLTNIKPDSIFWNPQALGSPEIGVQSPNTIFKDYLIVDQNHKLTLGDTTIFEIYLNASNKDIFDSIPSFLKNQFFKIGLNNSIVSIEYSSKIIPVKNDSDLTHQAINTISSVFGEQSIELLYGVIPNSGDDFAIFQQKIPGVYFFLGASNYETGVIAMPHAPFFAVDESCIKYGVNYFSTLIYERINK